MAGSLEGFFYVDEGSGPPVVLLHGFPFHHGMWASQLEAVGRTHRVLAYDLRGHGRSPVGDGQYTIEGHVDDLLAFLDHRELDRVTAVGLSMGGYIALRALERNPERFSAAVLADTRSEADTDEGKLKRAAGVANVKANGAAVFAEGFLPAVFAEESLRSMPEVVARIRTGIEATPELSLAGSLLAMAARTDTTASLASIAVPTLILVGEHDAVTPVASAEAMQARIPGSVLHVVPDAGHLSNLENPGFFNARLLEFLAGLPD